MEKLIAGLLVLVGIIHLLPVSGVLGPERLSTLYGIVNTTKNPQIFAAVPAFNNFKQKTEKINNQINGFAD